MLMVNITIVAALLTGIGFVVSYISRLRNDYSYVNQDVDRFIDSH